MRNPNVSSEDLRTAQAWLRANHSDKEACLRVVEFLQRELDRRDVHAKVWQIAKERGLVR